ncbi:MULTISPECIES: hypothetical protein [unclassified Streptomyces]|uniref:hypothetical protein n=1 Tax=unclassified Streptomyces TaxID=2593676 RepID=UPI003316D4CE
MALRIGLMGDSEAEVAAGVDLLRRLGLDVMVVLAPQEMSAGRWMARVMPQAPAVGEGLVER